MSYLSTSENVGFSGIPQTISDASCATQYKMAVEGVSTSCSEVNMFMHDNSGDEQSYITYNDNFYTKFKIDPNELYTFHDSDVIAGEITVSHTEDNFIFPDNVDVKSKLLDSPSKEIDIIGGFTNGEIKPEVKKVVVSNGHLFKKSKSQDGNKDGKSTHAKVAKSKTQNNEHKRSNSLTETRRLSVHSPKSQTTKATSPSSKTSINNATPSNVKPASAAKQTGGETFLDVFKREQGLVENNIVVKTETATPPPSVKVPASPPKKATSGKTASQSKPRKGRGPAVHEALQRIPALRRAIPIPNTAWHAPGDSLFSCGPLDDKQPTFRNIESSSDDDNMPDFESGCGAVCVEESAAESRGARLELRRAALRRHVARAHTTLRLSATHEHHRTLAKLIKMQLNGKKSKSSLPTVTVNHLLAMRGMPSVLTAQERTRLRASGWSGGDNGSSEGLCSEERCTRKALPLAQHCLLHVTLAPSQRLYVPNNDCTLRFPRAQWASGWSGGDSGSSEGLCNEERCTRMALPLAQHCLLHVTRAPSQRLYVPCAAVFAGGARCNQPLLPLHDQTPLCTEHAWKRDNYDKLSRDNRPKKAVRARVFPAPRAPRRVQRRRRPPARRPPAPPPPPDAEHSLSEINVCSNSSTYDSSEDTTMGALSDSEYITVPSNSHELEVEVGHVPADDILDPAVLSQIPDEAFTEFFNQAGGSTPFAESSELTAALEAVLDERTLDNINDCVFPHPAHLPNKMQVPASASMEMSSSAPS